MPSTRLLLLVGIAAAALAAGILAGRQSSADRAAPALRAATLLPVPRELPDVALREGDGEFRVRALAGRWTVVFFGFTHCPDVCPTTLALLAGVNRAFADLPETQRPRVLFISVDPPRDSPEAATTFARFFDPAFRGASGDDAALDALSRALGAPFHRDPPGADGAYAVDHSGAVFLLDPRARFAAVMTPPLDGAALALDLRALIGADPR